MPFSTNALWADIHGIVLGGLFLLAFSGGFIGLNSLRPEWVTLTGWRSLRRRLVAGMRLTAILAWLTVLLGTYLIYPEYRATPPKGATLSAYPKAGLRRTLMVLFTLAFLTAIIVAVMGVFLNKAAPIQ